MIKVYQVTPLVDEALKCTMKMYSEVDFHRKMHLDLHSFVLMGFMSDDEYKVFLRIKAIMDKLYNSNQNRVSYNDTLNKSCWIIEEDENSISSILVWSQKEEPLVNFLKETKNNLEKENKINIYKNSNNLWEWKDPEDDNKFEFKTELAAYADCIGYLKSVEELVNCSKQ